jgi:hypothetical protein
MSNKDIYYSWFKVDKNLKVISQSESGDYGRNFDHSPHDDYILWIEKSGPHGFYPSPDIYDDPIYHFKLFNPNKKPIENFHILNGWYLEGISTIDEFGESYYQQLHIKDPTGIVKKRKIWSFTSLKLSQSLHFIRDKLAIFKSWVEYENHKENNNS